MSDAELQDFALAQLSCLDDYHQQLVVRRQQLNGLMYEKTNCEQQVTSNERMIRERRQRLSTKQRRLASLQMIKEQTQMKMSSAAALGKQLGHMLSVLSYFSVDIFVILSVPVQGCSF